MSFGTSTPVATGISETISDGLELSAAVTMFAFASIEAPSPKVNALLDAVAIFLAVGGFESKSFDMLITFL